MQLQIGDIVWNDVVVTESGLSISIDEIELFSLDVSPSGKTRMRPDASTVRYNKLCAQVGLTKLSMLASFCDRANKTKKVDSAACVKARSELFLFFTKFVTKSNTPLSSDDFDFLMAHFCPFGIANDAKWNSHKLIRIACEAMT